MVVMPLSTTCQARAQAFGCRRRPRFSPRKLQRPRSFNRSPRTPRPSSALPGRPAGGWQAFLNSLVLFPPNDQASNLDPPDPTKDNFPQFGHGSIKLTLLFNDPADAE